MYYDAIMLLFDIMLFHSVYSTINENLCLTICYSNIEDIEEVEMRKDNGDDMALSIFMLSG